MEVIHAPTGPVEISDPNNVPEIVATGPFNIMRMGAMVLFTFTVVRPDTNAVFAGSKNPPYEGVVAARILMPTQMAEELVGVLGQTLAVPAPAPGRA